MPKDDPEPADPLSLAGVGVPDPSGESTRQMAACFAEEFLRSGRSPEEVMALFRSSGFRLAHAAWRALGEEAVHRIVMQAAATWSPAHRTPVRR